MHQFGGSIHFVYTSGGTFSSAKTEAAALSSIKLEKMDAEYILGVTFLDKLKS